MTDSEIIELYQKRDEGAIRQTQEKYQRYLRVRYQTSTKRSADEYDLSLEELDEVVSPGASPEEELDSAILRDAIGAFLRKQPVNVRKLFLSRYFSFQSLKEAAFSCGMSESKAKTVLFRLRKKLRSYLKKEGFSV